MAHVGHQQPVLAGSGPAQENQPPQLGDRGGLVGMGVFTAPRGTVIETDGGTALQLAAEPLTTHVVVAVLPWGADRPQPWRYPVVGAVWRDLPVLRAAVWPGGAGRHLPGALPWLRDCGNASPPPAKLRGALEHL